MGIKKHIKKYYLPFSLYVLTTFYFLFQHYAFLSWDFSAYVLNARYLFYGGSYFELYRAPLTSILLGVFMLFGNIGEYIYIFFVSTLFYLAMYKLSGTLFTKMFKKNFSHHLVFFFLLFFSLGPLFFMYSTLAGTELLSLSFFILFLSCFLEKKPSGHFLSLAFLSRYNFLIFFPFLLFKKDLRLITKDVVLFFSVSFLWFLWNFLNYGNWFSSIIDSYFLNVSSRQHLIEPFNWSYLFDAFNWRLLFFILGVAVSVYLLLRTKDKDVKKILVVFLITFAIFFYDIHNVPFKVKRYLFNLILPVSFFSFLGFSLVHRRLRIPKKTLILLCLIIFALTLARHTDMAVHSMGSREYYSGIAQTIKDENLTHCNIRSSLWVPISYYTENVYYMDMTLKEAMDKGYILLVFRNIKTRNDNYDEENLKGYEPFYEDEKIALYGDKAECQKKFESFNFPHHDTFCRTASERFDNTFLKDLSMDSCRMINLFQKKNLTVFR